MALQPLVGSRPLFSFLILYTFGRTPWTGDQPIARPLLTHRTTQTKNKRIQYKYPCLEWDSNLRSYRSREQRQFMSNDGSQGFSVLNIALFHSIPFSPVSQSVSSKRLSLAKTEQSYILR
jgi:hypothetical protein